ncbi:MAG: 16S rRNA (guanine(527)-N(7))-methyltransferase RsmG [Ruminobacter sp.]|nr:16S rRNA (guanine(527)-N(7))-methyltransferase RsmG [Ruminobacter sp.]
MTDLIEKLNHELFNIDLNLPEKTKIKLINFILLMDKWNKTYNLTSIRNVDQMVNKHLIDSLVVSKYLKGGNYIDVGTGPGLPGIPLALANPDKTFFLMDSQTKRINFIKQVKRELDIKNIHPILGRCENFDKSQYNNISFDGILSRAFASLEDMLRLCENICLDNTLFFALKGQLDEEELASVNGQYKIIKTIRLEVPKDLGDRHLIIVGKNNG